MSDAFKPLRDEAKKLEEPFSPGLHAKVMTAVKAAPASEPERAASFAWRYAAAAVVIIAVGIGVAIQMRPAADVAPPPVAKGDFGAMGELIEIAAAPVRENLGNGMPDQSYAYLDKDAARCARFMGRQLDQFPAGAP